MARTVYNDPNLAHAYKLVYRLCRAIGMFPWQEKWVNIERRWIEVCNRKWPDEDWSGLLTGVRMAE